MNNDHHEYMFNLLRDFIECLPPSKDNDYRQNKIEVIGATLSIYREYSDLLNRDFLNPFIEFCKIYGLRGDVFFREDGIVEFTATANNTD